MIERPCAESGFSAKARRAQASASRRVVTSSPPPEIGDQAYTVPSMPYKASWGPTTASPCSASARAATIRSEEHTSELQSQSNLVCRLLLEKKKNNTSLAPSHPHTLVHVTVPVT